MKVTLIKNKLNICFIFLSLLFYIAQVQSFGVPLIWFGIVGLVGFYLITTRIEKTLKIFTNKELFIVMLILITNLIFSQRLSSWDVENKSFIKQIIYALQHIVILYVTAFYGLKNSSNTITITRIFAIVLATSFIFFNIGMLFPEKFIQLRFALYGKYFEQLIEQGLFNISSALLAGLTPASNIFGYHVAGGFLIPSLFFIEKNKYWKIVWGIGSISVLITLFILAERSVVPALIFGFITFAILAPKKKMTIQKIVSTHLILLLAIVIIIGVFLKKDYFLGLFDVADKPIKLLHERFEVGDIGVRIGMQLAAVKIIIEKPLGLYFEGMREEDWGDIAIKKGYEVVMDANNIDYALVHNGYLRFVMYLGWLVGLAITLVLFYIFRNINLFKAITEGDDSDEKRYGRAVAASLVATLVQAMFHNDSLFTFEKTTWITFCLFIIWAKLIKLTELKHRVLANG